MMILVWGATAPLTQAQAPLWTSRDRLLDLYAQNKGMHDRCEVWNWMNGVRRGVFLTTTHNLWHHYLRVPEVRYSTTSQNPCAPEGTDCTYGCEGICTNPGSCIATGFCESVGSSTCWQLGQCDRIEPPREGAYAEKLIDHVDDVYTVLDGGDPYGRGSCGGMNNNRIFFSLDEAGIFALRNITLGFLPGIKQSGDWGGPHSPFNGSRETVDGKPRGQFQYFLRDQEAVPLTGRREMGQVYDPRAVEMDIDYNWKHDSNPLCTYGGHPGLDDYRDKWGETHRPNPWWPVEYQYSPGGCQGNRINPKGIVDAWTWEPKTSPGRYVAIFGAGFASAGNQVHFVKDALNQVLGVTPLYESPGQINVQVPNLLGKVFIYLTDSQGRRSNTETVLIQPE